MVVELPFLVSLEPLKILILAKWIDLLRLIRFKLLLKLLCWTSDGSLALLLLDFEVMSTLWPKAEVCSCLAHYHCSDKELEQICQGITNYA